VAPITCAEIRATNPLSVDGDYILYVARELQKPVAIYCADMATTPLEYLTLPAQSNANYSQATAGAGWVGSNVRTYFQRVRFDLGQLEIITNDLRFSTSQGMMDIGGGTTVTSEPYGSAASCDNLPSGVGNANLTGTPFALPPGSFAIGGYTPSGTTTYSSNNQIADLTGGGYCGWNAPIAFTLPAPPIVPLPVVYIGP